LRDIWEVLEILEIVIGFLEFLEDETELENAPHRLERGYFEKFFSMGVKAIEGLLGIAFGEIGRGAIA
jgi:flagellar biosynthesis/type III secretory pathway ATPase